MAYRITNIDPLDLQKIGIGVSIPFNGNAVFNTTYSTQDQIKSNIINFLLTNKNERIFNPTFGGNIRRFLFEPIIQENLNEVKDNIEQLLQNEFENIIIKNISILGKPDKNEIIFNLDYSIRNTNINDQINILLSE